MHGAHTTLGPPLGPTRGDRSGAPSLASVGARDADRSRGSIASPRSTRRARRLPREIRKRRVVAAGHPARRGSFMKFPWLNGEDVLAVRCLAAAYGWSTANRVLDLRIPYAALHLGKIVDGAAHEAPRLFLLALRGRLAVLAEEPYG